jgi:hypothetical protein
MNKNKGSVHILAIAIIAASALMAFAVSTAGPVMSAAEQSDVGYRTTKENKPQPVAVEGEVEHKENLHRSSIEANASLNHSKVTELRIAQHHLWIEHVVWTREYIVASVADAPSAQVAAERLLKNQEDIGNAIEPVYGEEAGDELAALLKGHILIAVDLLNAAKSGNNEALETAEIKWQANADEIATFLSEANPNWSKEEMVSMLNEHLSLTKSEAIARLKGDYIADAAAFDAIYKHAVSMADEFTDGIVKQFPEQFEV